ncbi:hypothetical protein HID58_071429 [Brassica napus]|uniref:X8 domain-containing protein n=1 Tax=Brassica napus TaxID=3708 RepID=A0ABQ7Z1J7_BRANA|nr:hypothetical protein HID58_071429 [Brassica napus]
MTLPHLHLSLLAATAIMLVAIADAQAGGQVLQAELWCVAKNNAEDSSLQTAIDWACGQGGADCSPIQQGRACNDPTDIQKMASYVFNNYYLKNGLADDACNFNNNAALTSINPSQGTCRYPSSKRVSNGRVADDTSMGSGQADMSRGRRVSTTWILLAFTILMYQLLTSTAQRSHLTMCPSSLLLVFSSVIKRRELVVHSKAIRKRLFFFYFSVDIVSVLPIPQVVVLTLVSRKQMTSVVSKEIYPIFKEVTRASGTVSQTKWVGAALNLFLYLLPSHVIGAFWYLSAIEKKDTCWHEACAKISGCNLTNYLCARGGTGGDNSRFLNTSCPLIDPEQIINSTVFNFGMYIDALKSGVKYLQSTTIRVDEWEEKKRDTEKWMSYRKLPENIKERIRKYEDYKWQETRSTEEEALLRSLPKDIRLETKHHFYMKLLKRVPWLSFMDDGWLLEALCDRVKPVFYSENSYIVRKGDICGDLLFWVLDPHPSSRVPSSVRTVITVTDVEGFILLPDDVKFVASHLNRLHSVKLKHMFRYYSMSWMSWGACYIQAAWRAHCRRKASKTLRAKKDKQQIQQDIQLNLGATLYVSRFVSKALRNRQDDSAECSSFSQMLPLVPHKPADPEFSKEEA